ncbi:MAG: ABC transporter permease subunit [Akkermansiaceae bacterium]|nr:ABC transporter permease subunit [Akkermansiaceae bacterium]MDG2325038.1 ABC transporter permease subunit [Akkermansiaceae bacterium]
MDDRLGTSFFSPRRAGIIALSTVTQLVRMKVFYFLAPIALLFVGLQFFDVFWYEGPEASQPQQELMMHKNLCLGTMMLFSSLFAIVSTALLIPGDIEDRTLYTILCKPVPRLDYLVGKLLGVISVIFVAMLVMDILMVVTLHYRTQAVSAELGEYLSAIGWGEEEVGQGQAEVASHGPSLILQYGVLAHFFKASIIAAVALLISTFSTSTLFTIASSVMIWIIGAVQSLAREGLFTKGEYGVEPGMVDRILGTIISLVFPDFQLFESVSDGAARAMEIGVFDMLHLGGLTFFYIAIYTVLSWFVFSDKEF